MKNYLRMFFLLVSILAIFVAYAGDKFGGSENVKKNVEADYLSALSASFEKAVEVRFNISGKSAVITSHRNYVVVSFVPKDKEIRGGGMHFVYDPLLKKVVHVLGED
jgi:hypothetical protein